MREKSLTKKLGAYTVAAGAAAALAGTANGAMMNYDNGGAGWFDQTSDWNQDMISFDYDGAVSLNTANLYVPDGNPKDAGTFTFQELDFFWYGTEEKDAMCLNIGTDAGYVAGVADEWSVGKLSADFIIDASLADSRVWSNHATTSTGGLGGWNFYFMGEWPFGGNAYVGLYSDEVDGRHYGWAHVNWSTWNNITLLEFAFSDTPGLGVFAGGGEIPEPMTLGLLALGATGLLVRRKRA
jgi:hypothetical protein